METENNTSDRILLALLREPFVKHTISSLAEGLDISRQGLWKVINKLKQDKLIIVENINKTRTGISLINLNWEHPLTDKKLSLIILKESLKQERWVDNFKSINENCSFLILFGSILQSPKNANDIDLIGVVSKKSDFNELDNKMRTIQLTQTKKIHFIDMTEDEFLNELKKPNKVYIEALKKGEVLFGHENFIKLMRRLSR
jgi:biotin operon repressor